MCRSRTGFRKLSILVAVQRKGAFAMSMSKGVVALLSGLLLAGVASAQPSPYDSPNDPGYSGNANGAALDPPTRVARLSLVQGAVSFVPAGADNWVQAEINRPLISGDKLWADRGARAELQIGTSVIRVDQRSSFHFLNLDDNMAQIELTEGTLNLRVRRIYDGQTYEVDTPTLAFVINRVGEYRIDVAPDGNGTIVTAFRGGGDAYGEAGARFRIEEGQSVRFNDPRLSDYVSNPVPNPDDFDRFCFDRDARWDNSVSRRYVSEDVIGYADLDSYGSWDSSPDYGNVWYPSQVAVGWTPYSYGRWSWVGAYGWTWVDSSPWGFAPFHYGRWAYINNRWGWCPGAIAVRPYYAPALVAFVGGGGARLSFSVGGPVGWFPLGPHDVYMPSYRVSRNYFTNINVHNTTINNVTINNFYGNYERGNVDYSRINYANRNVANAVTAVRGDVFTSSREVRGSVIPVNRETFANAHVAGFAAIAPTRASLAFEGGGATRAAAPPQAIQTRNIIAATRPPAPIAAFSQREAQLQRDPGRALPMAEMRSAPTVIGNGEAAKRAELSMRPNVNVVTREGMPARSMAPTVQPRSMPMQTESHAIDNPAQSNGKARVDNRNIENRNLDTRRTLDDNARLQHEQPLRTDSMRQVAPVEGRSVVVPPVNRAPADEQRTLPSSRYVNPNTVDAGNARRAPRNDDNPSNSPRVMDRISHDSTQAIHSETVEHPAQPKPDMMRRQQSVQMPPQQEMPIRNQQQSEFQARRQEYLQTQNPHVEQIHSPQQQEMAPRHPQNLPMERSQVQPQFQPRSVAPTPPPPQVHEQAAPKSERVRVNHEEHKENQQR